jgi:hypothetical protein
MKICKAQPARVFPVLVSPILTGYHGLDGGIGISWLGYMFKLVMPKPERGLSEKLAHTAGALSDIYILTTSCVAVNASEETHKLAETITRRILSSGHPTHCPPSWFRHDWEKQLWQEYQSGLIGVCGEVDFND